MQCSSCHWHVHPITKKFSPTNQACLHAHRCMLPFNKMFIRWYVIDVVYMEQLPSGETGCKSPNCPTNLCAVWRTVSDRSGIWCVHSYSAGQSLTRTFSLSVATVPWLTRLSSCSGWDTDDTQDIPKLWGNSDKYEYFAISLSFTKSLSLILMMPEWIQFTCHRREPCSWPEAAGW